MKDEEGRRVVRQCVARAGVARKEERKEGKGEKEERVGKKTRMCCTRVGHSFRMLPLLATAARGRVAGTRGKKETLPRRRVVTL